MRLFAFCLIAVTACSSSSSSPSAASPPAAPPPAGHAARDVGSATIDGSPDGQPFAVADAYAQRVELNDGTKPLRVVITDHGADACGANGSTTERMLTIDFGKESPPARAYTLGADEAPTVSFVTLDAKGASGSSAGSGTVTLTQVSSGLVSGTFDLTFDDGVVKGSFDATACEK